MPLNSRVRCFIPLDVPTPPVCPLSSYGLKAIMISPFPPEFYISFLTLFPPHPQDLLLSFEIPSGAACLFSIPCPHSSAGKAAGSPAAALQSVPRSSRLLLLAAPSHLLQLQQLPPQEQFRWASNPPFPPVNSSIVEAIRCFPMNPCPPLFSPS